MKNYEDMAKDVLQRIDAYEANQREKRAKITKAAASVTPVCAAAVVGVGLWKGGVLSANHNQFISSTVESEVSDVILSADNDTSAGRHSANNKNNTNRNSESATDRQAATADATISHATENVFEDREADNAPVEAKTPTADDKRVPASDNNANTNNDSQRETEAPAMLNEAPVQQTTPPVQQTEPATQSSPNHSGDFSGGENGIRIAISTLEWNGITYNDNETVDAAAYSRDKYIGKVSEFGGDHQNNCNYKVNPDDDVYTTKENAHVLIIVKANGTMIAMTNPAYLDGVVLTPKYEEVPYEDLQIYNGGFQEIN